MSVKRILPFWLLLCTSLWLGYYPAQHVKLKLFATKPLSSLARLAVQPIHDAQANLGEKIYLPEIANAYQALPAVQLTFDSFNNTEPALSPDNTTLLYISARLGQTDIYSMPLGGGVPVNISNTPTAQEDTPVFSPDGTSIAFAANRQGNWDIYLMHRNDGQIQMVIGQPGTDELHPAFLPDGQHLVFSSNHAGQWDIYSATLSSTLWTRLTATAETERFPTVSADGSTIAFRRELTQTDGALNSEIYVMQADGSAVQRVTFDAAFDGYPALSPDSSGLVFSSTRKQDVNIYTTNLGGASQTALVKPSDWHAQTPRLAPDGHTLLFAGNANGNNAALYLQPYQSPLAQVGQRGFQTLNGKCDWEAGVLAYGWIKVWRKTHQPEVWQWLKRWVDDCLARNPPIQHVNDALLGYAALAVYSEQPAENDLAFAQRVADYLMNTARRTADGTLTHVDDTVWDDTMVSITPFLVAMSQVTQNQRYFDEAVAQVLKHANHLQDAQTGLYHHAWDESEQRYVSAVYWCRGNSWALLADVEVLAAMPITHPQRAAVLTLLQRQVAALKPLQAPSGLWHTVLNRADFYEETSGSAMIAAALLTSTAAGWVAKPLFDENAQLARLGVWRQVTLDGRVMGVSAPTAPMSKESDYAAIPISPIELYGQGAVLWMGAVNAR